MTSNSTDAAAEISRGERFGFGENWSRFLRDIKESRIQEAERSLRALVGSDISGRSFIDVGSGSGLFSLAAKRLGVSRLHSFDFDPQSVACGRELKRRYFSDDDTWTIEMGSVLDDEYLATLNKWDIVYSWGVLHHTGEMWKALDRAAALVADGGTLVVAIYNDQGSVSQYWAAVKRAYNRLSRRLRFLVLWPAFILLWTPATVRDVLRGKPLRTWRNYGRQGGRGMSPWRDVVDWVGGYPFEVAKPERVFDFFRERGFILGRLTTCGGKLGCNEFMFRKIVDAGSR